MGRRRSEKGRGFQNTCNTNLKLFDSFVCSQWWFNLTMHMRGWIYTSVVTHFLVQFPVRATKRVNVESDFFFFLPWRIYGDSVGDKRCVCTVCLWGIITINRAILSYIQRVLWAAPLSYYRQQVQMVKGRCSVEKKRKRRRRGKKNKHLVPLL